MLSIFLYEGVVDPEIIDKAVNGHIFQKSDGIFLEEFAEFDKNNI